MTWNPENEDRPAPTCSLVDDGTLDTVIQCDDCGRAYRFGYAGYDTDTDTYDDTLSAEDAYDQFVEECLAEVADEHDCGEDDCDEDDAGDP